MGAWAREQALTLRRLQHALQMLHACMHACTHAWATCLAVVAGEREDRRAGVDVPQLDRLVPRARHQPVARVGDPPDARDVAAVPPEHLDAIAAVHQPHAHRLVGAPRCEVAAVR
eukprot:359062-Chlamydomonas_euryale.AAC.25